MLIGVEFDRPAEHDQEANPSAGFPQSPFWKKDVLGYNHHAIDEDGKENMELLRNGGGPIPVDTRK